MRAAEGSHAPTALGRPIRLYRARPVWRQPWRRLGFGLLALAAIGLPLILAAWRFSVGYIYLDALTALSWSRLWLLLAALAAADATALLVWTWLQSRQVVALHKGGLRVQIALRPPRLLPWQEIRGIASVIVQERFLHLPVQTHYRVTLYCARLPALRLPENLRDMSDLIQRLKAELYPRLEPELRQKFDSGASLAFGVVHLERQGLRLPGINPSPLPWSQVQALHMAQGQLIVQLRDGRRWQRSLGEIPNPEILIELAAPRLPAESEKSRP